MLAILKILAFICVVLAVYFAVTNKPLFAVPAMLGAGWCGWTHYRIRKYREDQRIWNDSKRKR